MGAAHMIPGGVRHGRIRGLGLGLLLLLAALLLVLRPHATAQAFVLKTPRRTSVCISPVRAPSLVLQAATAPLPPPPAKEDDIDVSLFTCRRPPATITMIDTAPQAHVVSVSHPFFINRSRRA